MKKPSFGFKKKTKHPWDPPSVREQLVRVLKGRPAHPNDERAGREAFLKSFLPKKRRD